MPDSPSGAMTDLERSLRNARAQIRILEEELETTSHGITALTLDLERAQERFRVLVENINAAFRLAPPGEARLLYASPIFESVWGVDPGALENGLEGLLEVVHSDDREVAEAQLLQPDFDDPQAQFRITSAGDTVRWVQDRVYPVRNSDGSLRYVAAITEDVTERNELERQLLHGQKMEAIGRLAGGIAHDFNNVLTAIGGHVQLVLDAMEVDEAWKEDLEEIGRSANRATALTRQLLAFSRQQVLNPQVLRLEAFIRDLHPMLSRFLGEQVRLRTHWRAPDARVRVDQGQVEQIVMNLVVNARDAMPEGGNLTIETDEVELTEEYARSHAGVVPGPHVVLRVTDTGQGMPKEVQEQIFEPFFTTKGPSEGTGLGLSTIYGIVKQSGGHIFVYSELGEGTTFKIYFPRTRDEISEADSSEQVTEAPVGGIETILVVEDDDAVRRVTLRILEKAGYTLIGVGSGAEALAVVKRCHGEIELILTDIVLPDRSGLDLGKEIASLKPDARIIYTSGYSSEVVSGGEVLGEEKAFLEKPFTPEALLREVRAVLDRAG